MTERVHQVCYYLHKLRAAHGEDVKAHCNECPAKTKTKHGYGTQMCRLIADECIRVVLHGSPFGEKGKQPWPKKLNR